MARRPPTHPLPRGLVWRQFTAEMPMGLPLAEWAYVTPQHPDGIRTSAVSSMTSADQFETAQFWFLSNYKPFINDGRWFGFGSGNAGFGQGAFAPDHWMPRDILNDEFGGLLSEDTLSQLTANLKAQAEFWMLIPNHAHASLSIGDDKLGQDDILDTLNRLEKAIQVLASAHGGIGHNQGPPILDQREQENVSHAIKEARSGIEKGQGGIAEVKEAQTKFAVARQSVRKGLLTGFATAAGADAYHPTKHLAIQLFHNLHETIAALEHWIALVTSNHAVNQLVSTIST